MNPNTTLYVTFAVLTLVLAAAAVWWYRKNRPQHSLLLWDFGTGSVMPRRVRNLHGPFHVKLGHGKKLLIPVPEGYASPRKDLKGFIFNADLATGNLFVPTKGDSDAVNFNFANGAFVELALADGREKNAAQATQHSGGVKMEHLAMGIGAIFVLLIIIVYQFARAGGI